MKLLLSLVFLVPITSSWASPVVDMGAAKCSDASGKLRRQTSHQNNNLEVSWIFQEEAIQTRQVKILWDTRTQVRGNEENGAYVLDVEVTYQGRTFMVPMLCRSYHPIE